ncbi:hypothetical protein RRG08_015904 [Elysia crispata]|uniref:Uncharacterized protein n=1 Tax=Elysia crispata TaxID=231223 RepID=A0AAE1AMR9_9GAST|nr:hypothetical protein RRG08_015904 [Elysia crispata]
MCQEESKHFVMKTRQIAEVSPFSSLEWQLTDWLADSVWCESPQWISGFMRHSPMLDAAAQTGWGDAGLAALSDRQAERWVTQLQRWKSGPDQTVNSCGAVWLQQAARLKKNLTTRSKQAEYVWEKSQACRPGFLGKTGKPQHVCHRNIPDQGQCGTRRRADTGRNRASGPGLRTALFILTRPREFGKHT